MSKSSVRSAIRRVRTSISADGTGTVCTVTSVTIPVSPMPPTVAQKPAASLLGLERADLAAAVDQVERVDPLTEASVDVVVLAMDVGGDGAAERDIGRARQDGQAQSLGQQLPERAPQRRPSGESGQAGLTVQLDRSMRLERCDERAAGVLRRVAVAAPEPAREEPA